MIDVKKLRPGDFLACPDDKLEDCRIHLWNKATFLYWIEDRMYCYFWNPDMKKEEIDFFVCPCKCIDYCHASSNLNEGERK